MKDGDINTADISKSEGMMLAHLLSLAVTEYFSVPEHEKAFKEWKKTKKCADAEN